MAHSPHADIEDLTLCSFCKRPFDDGEQQPKVLSCKHHFCLKCVNTVLLKGRELYCAHCWKRTDVPDLRTDALPTYTAVLALAQRLGSLPPPPKDKQQHAPHAAHAPHGVHPQHKIKSENCHTHAMPYTLWCHSCGLQICRACASHVDHLDHAVEPQADAKQMLRRDFQQELALMQKTLAEIQRLASKQREFLLKILEACTTLKTQVETDLVNNMPSYELSEARDCLQKAHRSYAATESQSPAEIHSLLAGLAGDKERLQAKHREMFLQCKLDDLIKNSSVAFDFDLLKQALAGIHSGEVAVQSDDGYRSPILFLANYCMSQLYSRHFLFKQQQQQPYAHGQNGGGVAGGLAYAPLAMPGKNGPPELGPPKPAPDAYAGEPPAALVGPLSSPAAAFDAGAGPPQGGLASPQGPPPPGPPALLHRPPQPTLLRNPPTHVYPVYYFNVEINGSPFGRILIEVRSDVAPKMAKNFGILSTGELGVGYKGCNIFQCWENESIITGDFELNNGRGGRSIFEDGFFMPDDTKILASRGSVGMRRSQKRHDNLGLVGSQFRIILREMRGFTGIFAFVVEGLELVDRISRSGDSAGKPQSSVLIASCGKLN